MADQRRIQQVDKEKTSNPMSSCQIKHNVVSKNGGFRNYLMVHTPSEEASIVGGISICSRTVGAAKFDEK